MSKHLLLYTDDPGLGGVGQYNHSILCGLVALNYRVTCVQTKSFNPLVEQQSELGVQHVWLDFDTVKGFGRTLTDQSDAQEILTSSNPDLIIFSDSCPVSNFAAKQVAIQLGIPYVLIVGFVAPYLAERFAAYLDELSHHYAQAKAVIAVSTENLSLLHKLFRLPKSKGQVIYYGRPAQYFSPSVLSVREYLRQEFAISSDAIVCFTAARLEAVKGYQYQLKAIRQLKQSSIWPQLYFVWAGPGALENQLKEAVKHLEVTEQVKILGQRWDIPDWLDASDIFVLPSELEGMPLAVIEAMAKGLPVIASAVSGIPEELGNTGKLLPSPAIEPQATVRELVTTIQDWSINLELRHSIGQSCKRRAEEMFREERMVEQTVEVIEHALLPVGDYVSPGFSIVCPDECFPNMVVEDTSACLWPYLRREIPHNWYVDKRQPTVGFLSRDEAHILYNTALKFKGKRALEIGCWLGWSACHLALAGIELDVVDPLLGRPKFYKSVSSSLRAAGVLDSVNLIAGYSPQRVEELAAQLQRKWSLIFIDGNHDAPGPLNDAIACEQLAEADALILFHDLASPDVAQGLDYLKQKGWHTMIYQTMQIMGVAWRGNVEPVRHQPDSKTYWELPEHLQHYSVSGLSKDLPEDEFLEILNAVRPYTLLSEARLFSLYSLAKQVCLNDVSGDFVECGTCKGGSAALLAFVIQRYSLRPRMLYAFDTFEGMPDPTEVDRHRGVPANITGFGAGTLEAPISGNLDKICELLGVRDIIVPIQGLFTQTLPKYRSEIGSIAFLHADGDWYESTMDIFNTLYDSVVSNGIIQIDDYGHWEGCQKAVHDFERLRGESFSLETIDYTGVWFQKNRAIDGLEPLLSQIRNCINQYQKDPTNQSILTDLRQARQKIANQWLSLPLDQLGSAYMGDLGKVHKVLLSSGIEDEPLVDFEQSFTDNLVDLAKGFDEPRAVQYLLATMLYYRADQLPLPHDLAYIPNWFIGDYLDFAFSPLKHFQKIGEADDYCQYMTQLVNYLHSSITSSSDYELWQDKANYFTNKANFISLYFNNANLKNIYTKRADIIELYLKNRSCQVDHEFLERSPEQKKIRLGILAAHFEPQTETFATLPVYKYLNRDLFEIILFALNTSNHRLERYCVGHADALVQLPVDLPSQVQTVRETELDILFISTNVTAVSHPVTLLALHRLARVQIVDANSPVTTGMCHVDYYISSKLSESAAAQQHYTETLIELDSPPQCFDFGTEEQLLTTISTSREDLDIDKNTVVYISGANYYKIIPELETAWAKIIASIPNSVLLLYPFNPNWSSSYPATAFQRRITRTFSQHGLNQDKLLILDTAPNRADVKERLQLGDVYLDSYPYSGMTSLIDPLEVGLPIVVREGEYSRSKKGASLLRELQIPDLIADSEEAYIQLAIALGTNPELRKQKSEQIKQRMQANPRFLDSRAYSAQMGAVFQELFRKYQEDALKKNLKLREINLIAFPDWNQTEELLYQDLASAIRIVATHPDKSNVTLLIDSSNVSEENANLALADVVMHLLLEEDLDVTDGPEVSLIGELSEVEWQALLPRIQSRIVLENENKQAIIGTGASNISIFELIQLSSE